MSAVQPESQSSEEEDENTIVIPIDRSFSDGDPAIWPKEARFQRPDDSGYRRKLAVMWLKHMGAYEKGMSYILDSLPEGYSLFDRARGTNPDIRDRFLYGHPAGQYFYSTIQFFPHFYYLMTGGTSTCNCVLCVKLEKIKAREKGYSGMAPKRKPAGRPSGVSRGKPEKLVAKPDDRPDDKPVSKPVGRPVNRLAGRSVGRPVGRPSHPVVDSEGTTDVFKLAVMELKENGKIDKRVIENTSMDWRAEKALLKEKLEKLDLQPSYIPRSGEIVLWAPSINDELHWNSATQCVETYSAQEDRWLGPPAWRAGVIGQDPEEEIVLQDLVETAPKAWDVNYSGFRIETFPDPLSDDKSYSLHYKYVPLKCIKPFNAFELFLQGIPREQFHSSIEYALTVMSSYTLLDKYHIKGTWPHASIFCRGIFIGAELLIIGDAVRIKPKGYDPASPQKAAVTDVMVIDEIRLELRNCDHNVKSKQLAENYKIIIRGKIYTTNFAHAHMEYDSNKRPFQALSPQEVTNTFQYVDMAGYGDWYRLHAGKVASVSQDMVIGRCHEPDAMRLLYGSPSSSISATWSHDLQGITVAREYSRQTDNRIPEGKNWFWGDFRTQTLGLDSLNGEDVGYYSEARNAKMWRANLKVIDGVASPADLRAAKIPGEIGRPVNKSRSSFAEVGKTSSLVSTGLGTTTDVSNNASSADETGGQVSTSSGVVDDDDEDEGEEEKEQQHKRSKH